MSRMGKPVLVLHEGNPNAPKLPISPAIPAEDVLTPEEQPPARQIDADADFMGRDADMLLGSDVPFELDPAGALRQK